MKQIDAVTILVTSIGLITLALVVTAGVVGVVIGEWRPTIGLTVSIFGGLLMLALVCVFVWTFNPSQGKDKTQ
ncbi:MAG TPA: hypothetical protein PKM21_03030 [Anaerolineales bacterium]|nr:hypothetical protein [Anaerolineales bacterium]